VGGNAFKEVTKSKRLDRAEYRAFYDKVLKKVREEVKAPIIVNVIPAYGNKDSFGDLDLLITFPEKVYSGTYQNLFDRILEVFRPNREHVYQNSDVLSILYEGFQIDFIYAPITSYDFAYGYFSFNDLGNLIGRIFHKLGLKFGHNGLHYLLRDEESGGHVTEDILVSLDFNHVLKFIGLNSLAYSSGTFQELEDIFRYVSASPFFSPEIYLFDNLNHVQRIRDRKRATYNSFLEWCKTMEETTWKGNHKILYAEDKALYLPFIFSHFEGFKLAYEKGRKNYAKKKLVKTKFNGDLVSQITGLSGKPLGDFIIFFKKSMEKEEGRSFNEIIEQTPVENLVSLIKELKHDLTPYL
jgi:hypothetical protein